METKDPSGMPDAQHGNCRSINLETMDELLHISPIKSVWSFLRRVERDLLNVVKLPGLYSDAVPLESAPAPSCQRLTQRRSKQARVHNNWM